jgi:hypothetical protein
MTKIETVFTTGLVLLGIYGIYWTLHFLGSNPIAL